MAAQDALERAKRLVKEILQLARAHDHKALLRIDADPETVSLLSLLPERESAQAMTHLEGARIWRAKRNRKAQQKLDSAATALSELDLVLARGILRKIDSEVLGAEELARYDELLLAIEARAMELEEIQSRLPEEQTPEPGKGPRRRWGFFGR